MIVNVPAIAVLGELKDHTYPLHATQAFEFETFHGMGHQHLGMYKTAIIVGLAKELTEAEPSILISSMEMLKNNETILIVARELRESTWVDRPPYASMALTIQSTEVLDELDRLGHCQHCGRRSTDG